MVELVGINRWVPGIENSLVARGPCMDMMGTLRLSHNVREMGKYKSQGTSESAQNMLDTIFSSQRRFIYQLHNLRRHHKNNGGWHASSSASQFKNS